MKAVETPLNTFLSQNKTQFVIPVYQRNYDWTEAECRQLFGDILSIGIKGSSTHFIGSIVFIHEGVYTTSEVKQLVVIDGQQRLTTFTLLYLALYKFALNNNLAEKANEINETYIQNKFVKDDGSKLKLKQSDVNAKAFRFLLSEKDPSRFTEYSHVVENFKFFYDRISADNFEIIMNGINRLLFVEISLERDKDDPQRIFESLNSTGLELSQADLIRNYILMDLKPDQQQRIYIEFWEIIENNAKDYKLNETLVSDFIRDYITAKIKRIPIKSKVYEEFKGRYSNRDSVFYNEILNELKEFSYHYRNLINPVMETDSEISKELRCINQLEVNVTYPFLMPVYHDFKQQIISKEIFLDILKLIQSYVWRRFISGLPTSALGKVFMYLYNDVDPENYLSSIARTLIKKRGAHRFPDDKEIETELAHRDVYNTKAKNRLYFLELLENYNNREYVSLNNPDITVEHIFPQTPNQNWKTDISSEDYYQFQEKYLNTIANLTLTGNNGSLGNRSFLEKKTLNIENKEQGYIYSRLWVNKFLSESEKWDILKMQERYTMILERFYAIWRYPEIENDEDFETDEDFTIYNAPDPRYKKLDYFIFKDEKIETSEVSKMYYHVIKTVLNENPALFYRDDIKSLLGISLTTTGLRAPFQLNSNLYIEANIDNNSKFRKLKELLIKLDLQEELLINFSELDSIQANDEQFERSFWESRDVQEFMNITDECLNILKSIDSNLSLNYKSKYIGITQNNIVQNFVLFMPSTNSARIAIRVKDKEKWIKKIEENNCKFVSTGKNMQRIKFIVNKQNVIQNREFLNEIFRCAYDELMS